MPRLTFGMLELYDGIPLLAVAIGTLALSEILVQIDDGWRGDHRYSQRDEGALAFGSREARQRLIEEEDLRLRAKRYSEIDEALSAVGEFAGLDGLDPFQAEKTHEFLRFGMNIGIVVDIAPCIESRRLVRLKRQSDVLV